MIRNNGRGAADYFFTSAKITDKNDKIAENMFLYEGNVRTCLPALAAGKYQLWANRRIMWSQCSTGDPRILENPLAVHCCSHSAMTHPP